MCLISVDFHYLTNRKDFTTNYMMKFFVIMLLKILFFSGCTVQEFNNSDESIDDAEKSPEEISTPSKPAQIIKKQSSPKIENKIGQDPEKILGSDNKTVTKGKPKNPNPHQDFLKQ